MVRAILRDGTISPISPLPDTWSEGQELVVESAPLPTKEEWDSWSREIDELAAQIPLDDFERVELALAEADKKAKEMVRRQMGLS
jgi:hypothetical protein